MSEINEDWCKDCNAPRKVVEISIEQQLTGPYEETSFRVIRLECGDEIVLFEGKRYFE